MEYKLTMIQYYDAGQVFPRYLQRSIQRWKKNGLVAKKQTGNKRKTILKGEHLMILAAYKRIFPRAKASQCAVCDRERVAFKQAAGECERFRAQARHLATAVLHAPLPLPHRSQLDLLLCGHLTLEQQSHLKCKDQGTSEERGGVVKFSWEDG